MEHMEDWIRPEAMRLLAHAEEGEVAISYNDDGSLTATLGYDGKVQIVNFNGQRKAPYRSVWVSDSHTKIRADFSRSSTDAFRETHKRQFDRATLGAVLDVSACSLKFYPNPKKFTLLVDKFNFCGEEGSQDYGQPVAIEDDGHLFKGFAELAKAVNVGPGITSPVRSQTGIFSDALSDQGGDLAIQDVFHTQMPCQQANATLTTPSNLHVRSDVGTNPNSQKIALLALLNAPSAANVGVLTSNRSNGTIAQASPPGEYSAKFAHPLQPSASGNLDSESVQPSFQLLPPTIARLDNSNKTEMKRESHLQPEDEEVFRDGSHKNKINNRKDSESTTKTVADREKMKCVEPLAVVREEYENHNSNPWEGLARIPRNHVRIPQDQRTVLDREDSWYSSIAIHDEVYVKLPQKLVAELGDFYERPLPIGRAHDKWPKVTGSKECGSVSSESDTGYDSDHHRTVGEVEQNSHGKQATPRSLQPSLPLPDNSSTSSRKSPKELDSDNETSWPSSTPESLRRKSKNSLLERIESPRSSAITEALSVSDGETYPHAKSLTAELEIHSSYTREKGTDAWENERRPFNNAAAIFSSSVAEDYEMELVVPYAVDDVMDVLEKDNITGSPGRSQCSSSPNSHSNDKLEVARTPRAVATDIGVQSLNETSRSMHARAIQSNDGGTLDIFASSAVIPGTFVDVMAAGSTSPTRSLTGRDLHVSSQYSGYEQLCIASKSKVLCAPISSPLTDDGDDDALADEQIYAECLTYSQRGENTVEPCNEYDYQSAELGGSQSDVISIASNGLALPPSVVVQLSSSERPKEPWSTRSIQNGAGGDHETFTASNVRKLKRPAQEVIESHMVKHKRRGPFKPSGFVLTQEEFTTMDPYEMVKANRRNFVQGQSVQKRSFAVAAETSHQSVAPVPNIEPSDQQYTETSSSLLAISAATPTFLSVKEPSSESKSIAALSDEPAVICLGPFIEDSEADDSGEDEKESEQVWETAKDNQLTNFEHAAAEGHNTGDLMATKGKMGRYELSSPEKPVVVCIKQTDQAAKDLFESFNLAYPSYANNLKPFVRACAYIEWLVETMSAPHPFLWDDFIRVFSTEFVDYVHECRASNQKPLSGVKFYDTRIPAPLFTMQIVTPATLQDALLLDVVESAAVRSAYRTKTSDIHIPQDFSTITTPVIGPAKRPIDASFNASKQALSFPFIKVIEAKEITSLHDEQAKLKSRSDWEITPVLSSNRKDASKLFFQTPSQLHVKAHKKFASSSLPISPILDDPRKPVTCVFSNISRLVESHDSPVTEKPNGTCIRDSARKLPQEFPRESSSENRKSKSSLGESTHMMRERARHISHSGSIRRQASPVLGATLDTDSWSPSFSPKSSDQAEPLAPADISFATPTLPIPRATEKSLGISVTSSVKVATVKRRRDRNKSAVSYGRAGIGSSDNDHKKFTSYKEAAMAYIPRRKREGL